MRPAKYSGVLSLALALLACTLFLLVPESPASPTSLPAPPSQKTPEPKPESPSELDKWSLWTNGTQLRGANTWQRIVVPKYDGDEFLGDGYIPDDLIESVWSAADVQAAWIEMWRMTVR